MMEMESEDANDRRSSYDDYDDHLHPTHTIIVTWSNDDSDYGNASDADCGTKR